jgi:hypothetical protein
MRPKVSVETITPDRAREMLLKLAPNRRLSTRIVESYLRTMERGEWLPATGEPLNFRTDGMLENGQHRLTAQLSAGIDIDYIVRVGDDSAQDVADSGRKRKFDDVLAIRGIKNARGLASVTRLLLYYEQTGMIGRSSGGTSVTSGNPELLAYFDEHREEIEEAHARGKLTWSAIPGASASIMAASYAVFKRIDPVEVDPFWAGLVSGRGLLEGDPILAFRNYMTRADIRSGDRTMSPRLQAALLVKAFNYWREGREVRVLSWRAGGGSKEAFPRIETPEEQLAEEPEERVEEPVPAA